MKLNNRITCLERLGKPASPKICPPLDDSLPDHWHDYVKCKVDVGGYIPNMTIERFHEIRNAMLAVDDC
jgi:hypothetical protein